MVGEIKIEQASPKPVLRLSNNIIEPSELSPEIIAALAKSAGLREGSTLNDFEVKHFSDETQATIHLIRIKSLSAGVKLLVESGVLHVSRGMKEQGFHKDLDKLIDNAEQELKPYQSNSSVDRVACQNILAGYKKAVKDLMRTWLSRADNTLLLNDAALDTYMDQGEKFAVLKAGRVPLFTIQKHDKPKTEADKSKHRPLVNGLIFLIECGDLIVVAPYKKEEVIKAILALGESRYDLRLFMGVHLQKPGRIPLQLDDEIYGLLDLGAEKFAAYMATPVYTMQSEVPQSALTVRLTREYYLVAEYLYYEQKGSLNLIESVVGEANKLKWFRKLNPDQRKMLWNVLKNSNDMIPSVHEIADKIRTIPSELRIIPGMANHSLHKLTEMDEKAVMRTVSTKLRSSMIASRDLGMTSTGARSDHALHSAMVVIENGINHVLKDHIQKMLDLGRIKKGETITVPFLMQTLVSPLMVAAFFMPDYNLHVDKQLAVEAMRKLLAKERIVIAGVNVNVELVSTNHPQNTLGRALDPTTPQGESGQEGLKLAVMGMRFVLDLRTKATRLLEDADRLIGEITRSSGVDKDNKFAEVRELKKHSDILMQQAHVLETAAHELQATISNRPALDFAERLIMGNVRHNRELHIASLEQVITQKMGGVDYGSCVSGKDRKALEVLHTDAMLVYYERYKKWPGYKTEDANFAEIFAELYCSRHQQNNACQNMPGSCGIKHPADYLPKYIVHAVENKLQALSLGTLDDDERRATNNKVPSIKAEKAESPSYVGAVFKFLFVNVIGGAVAFALGAVGGFLSRAIDSVLSVVKVKDQQVTQYALARNRVEEQKQQIAKKLPHKQAIIENMQRAQLSSASVHNSEASVVGAMGIPAASIAPVVVVTPSAPIGAIPAGSPSSVVPPSDLSLDHGR